MKGIAGLLPFFVLLAVAAYVLFRGRRQRAELDSVQHRLTQGVEVMTASGMYGTVTSVDDDVVTLQTGPGQTSRWDRRAMARIVTAVPPSSVDVRQDAEPAGPSDGVARQPGGDKQATA